MQLKAAGGGLHSDLEELKRKNSECDAQVGGAATREPRGPLSCCKTKQLCIKRKEKCSNRNIIQQKDRLAGAVLRMPAGEERRASHHQSPGRHAVVL